MSCLNRFMSDKPRDDLTQSVARNIVNLISTCRGFGYLLQEVGTAEFRQAQSGTQTARKLLEEIRHNIELFEPRLRLTDIRCTGRDPKLRLHIHVRGTLGPRRPCHLLILFHVPTAAFEVEVCDDP